MRFPYHVLNDIGSGTFGTGLYASLLSGLTSGRRVQKVRSFITFAYPALGLTYLFSMTKDEFKLWDAFLYVLDMCRLLSPYRNNGGF